MSVVLQRDDQAQAAWRLVMDGKLLATVAARQSEAKLDPAQSRNLLAAIPMGLKLEVVEGGKTVGVISMAGSSAALRWVDDQQKRAGGVTALVAKGTRAASAVPAPPALPVVRRAPAVAQTNLPRTPPASMAAKVRACEEDNRIGRETRVHRLGSDAILWLVPCGDGAYNFSEEVVVTDGKGALLPGAWPDADTVLINADYDDKSQTLQQYSKGRGLGDCGMTSAWVWAGRAFAKTEETYMPVCRGLSVFWPTTHRARVVPAN